MVVDIRSNRFLFKLAAFFSPSLSFVEVRLRGSIQSLRVKVAISLRSMGVAQSVGP